MNSGGLTFKTWMFKVFAFCVVAMAGLLVFSFLGDPMVSPRDLFFSPDELLRELFFSVRLPRLVLACLVGAALSTSGVAFQALLNNPLADPYILGVSGGAALGGVLGLLLGFSFQGLSVLSFVMALGSLFFIAWIADTAGRFSTHSLLLVGVIYNAFCFALILFFHSMSPMGRSQQILYLMMGSIEATSWKTIATCAIVMGIGLLGLVFQSFRMNLVSLGEESAMQLGLDVNKHRRYVFIFASLLVGASVSVAGLIGFVGLFVPHMVRYLVGNDHRMVIPVSLFFGSLFMVICDFLARNVLKITEWSSQLPVGVITALIGGPFFFYLFKREGRA